MNKKEFISFICTIFISCFLLQFTIFRILSNDFIKVLILVVVNSIITFTILRKKNNG